MSAPHVTVLTPVYNGERYVADCIESVLRQTHENWDYVLVNNCSTDGTLAILDRYAAADRRIRVVTNTRFVDVIGNHNNAFAQMPADSDYCKIVSADDWLYPECLERMVGVGERCAAVGVIGCYALTANGVLRRGPRELDQECFLGRDAARSHLLGLEVLNAPTTVMYRGDVVRATTPFFSEPTPNADIHASFQILEHYDFGFVHQILCGQRVHDESVSSKLTRYNAFLVDRIEWVARYGKIFLTAEERARRLAELLPEYYAFLADQKIHSAAPDFWTYHRTRMAAIGLRLNEGRLLAALGERVLDWGANPKRTLEKIWSRLGRS